MLGRFRVLFNCWLSIRRASGIVFGSAWAPRALTFSNVSKRAVIASDLINDSSSLVVLGPIFWFLEDLAKRLAWFESRANVKLSEHATNPVRGTAYVRYAGKVHRSFLRTFRPRVDCEPLLMDIEEIQVVLLNILALLLLFITLQPPIVENSYPLQQRLFPNFRGSAFRGRDVFFSDIRARISILEKHWWNTRIIFETSDWHCAITIASYNVWKTPRSPTPPET